MNFCLVVHASHLPPGITLTLNITIPLQGRKQTKLVEGTVTGGEIRIKRQSSKIFRTPSFLLQHATFEYCIRKKAEKLINGHAKENVAKFDSFTLGLKTTAKHSQPY